MREQNYSQYYSLLKDTVTVPRQVVNIHSSNWNGAYICVKVLGKRLFDCPEQNQGGLPT